MAYTNKLRNNMDQLIKVIDSASLPARVYWDFEKAVGNEFIVINNLPSDLITNLSDGVSRSYSFQINYYMVLNNTQTALESISRRVDKLEKKLNENIHRNDGGTYYWHDGNVGELEIGGDLEDFEDLENLHVGRLTFTFTNTEVF